MDKILAPLLHSPLLPDYLAQLNHYWQEEKLKRKAFYDWLDEDTRAEFIEGEIVIHSPARQAHIATLDNLGEQIKAFVVVRKLGLVCKGQALVKMKRSDVMPGLLYFNNQTALKITNQTKLFPVPDFIAAVLSPSTEKNDRNKKMIEYALNGVKEYWIVDADLQTIEQYLLIGDKYQIRKKYEKLETVECIVLKGLMIDVSSLFNEEESQQALLNILMSGKD